MDKSKKGIGINHGIFVGTKNWGYKLGYELDFIDWVRKRDFKDTVLDGVLKVMRQKLMLSDLSHIRRLLYQLSYTSIS